MNDNREFDELARRKLDERSFSFEEGHWAGVEQALKAERRRGRRGWWLLPAAALLLAPAALLLRHDDRADTSAELADHSTVAAPLPIAHTGADHRSEVSNQATGATRTSALTTSSTITAATQHEAAAEARTPATPVTVIPAHRKETPDHAPASARTHGVAPAAHAMERDRQDHPYKNTVSSHASLTNDPTAVASTPIAPPAAVPDPAVNGTGQAFSASITPTTTTNEPITAPAAPVQQDKGPDPNAAGIASTSDNAAVVTSTTTAASDSTTNTPPPTAQATVKAIGAWGIELSGLGGLLNTTQAFTPDALLDAHSAAEGSNASAFGAEGMWLRPHWGIGTGLHYTTFAERINSERLATSSTSIAYNYAVQSVETTLVVVTGTYVIDSVTYYTTTMKDTVLNVLSIHRDTVTTTIQRRAARQLMNTVSYMEIPLLLDAHTSKGRFTFGVRGGPTIGFLQQQRTALPNLTEDGYNDLRREQLRSTVLGYQARLYVRYRLGGPWSIGVEPMLRGQLRSMFGDALPVSKATAMGAYLSVSYRLR